MKTFMHFTRFWHVRMLKLKPKEKYCKVCGKTFETKSNLKDHMLMNHHENMHAEFVTKLSRQSPILRNMLMNHNEKLAFKVCGKTFKTRVQSKGSYVNVSSKL